MDSNNHSPTSFIDIVLIWVGTLLGQLTLSDAVLWVTLLFTLVRLYVLIRDDLFKDKP